MRTPVSASTPAAARARTWYQHPYSHPSHAGFAGSKAEATTSNLVKALGEHIGKPMSLRVVRPGNMETTLSITAQEAGDGHH